MAKIAIVANVAVFMFFIFFKLPILGEHRHDICHIYAYRAVLKSYMSLYSYEPYLIGVEVYETWASENMLPLLLDPGKPNTFGNPRNIERRTKECGGHCMQIGGGAEHDLP